jgi:integrase/recombinase XerD
MQVQRGTLEATIANYRLPVYQLMSDLGTDTTEYTAQKLRAFFLKRTSVSHPSKAKNFTTAIRMFLRFLIARGDCTPGIDQAIPTGEVAAGITAKIYICQ